MGLVNVFFAAAAHRVSSSFLDKVVVPPNETSPNGMGATHRMKHGHQIEAYKISFIR